MRRASMVAGIALLAVSLVATSVFAQAVVHGYAARGVVTITRPAHGAQDTRVRDKLNEMLVTFTFSDQPLAEAIDFLQVLAGENIVLDRRSIDDGKTVTLKLKDVTLSAALNIITDQVELKWVVRDGIIVIGDEDATKLVPVTTVHDVLPLLATIPDFEGPEINLAMMNRSNGDSGRDNIMFPEHEEEKERPKTRQELMDELVEVIRAVIAPETWDSID